MRAVCWRGITDVRVENVPDPELLSPSDVIVRVTSTAICGSDLHLYNGFIPAMRSGDILGHEFMGEVIEIGREVRNLAPGDRVIVPFPIACGNCYYCHQQLWSLCDNSNPNPEIAAEMYGFSPCGIFGYSHVFGGYAGGQAEYVRVPFGDVGPYKVPEELSDEQVLFLTDVFPTGYMGAENCDIRPGDTVAVWGCGPVGLMSIVSAYLLGAGRVIAIDRVPERLRLARENASAETIDYSQTDVFYELLEMTAGRGPDACVDAVGLEAHGTGLEGAYDRAKQAVRMQTGRPNVLREAITACRKGGTLSIPGVYAGILDKIPMGAAFNKGLTFRMGQTHVHRYLDRLTELIRTGQADASFIITHRLPLDEAPDAYAIFAEKEDGCIKVVLTP